MNEHHMDPRELARLGRSHREDGLSPSTRRDLASAWRGFERWCSRSGSSPLPASPDAVCRFLADQAERVTVQTLRRALRAIDHFHALEGFASPAADEMVQDVLVGIRVRLGDLAPADSPVREAVDLPDVLHSDLLLMVQAQPDSLLGLRDSALLLTGGAGGLTRAQLVGLDVSDMELMFGRSVIHVESATPPREIEVYSQSPEWDLGRAVERWLDAAEVTMGPLFRPVGRGGPVGKAALSRQALTPVLRRAARLADLPASAASSSLFERPRE